jgi:hypothetical protein
MAQKRQTRKRPKSTKRGDNASLYPLDPELAIRAIMKAGPHPREERSANSSRTMHRRKNESKNASQKRDR